MEEAGIASWLGQGPWESPWWGEGCYPTLMESSDLAPSSARLTGWEESEQQNVALVSASVAERVAPTPDPQPSP